MGSQLVSVLRSSPIYLSHEWPFGRETTLCLGDDNDHHGYEPLKLTGMILQVSGVNGFIPNTSFSWMFPFQIAFFGLKMGVILTTETNWEPILQVADFYPPKSSPCVAFCCVQRFSNWTMRAACRFVRFNLKSHTPGHGGRFVFWQMMKILAWDFFETPEWNVILYALPLSSQQVFFRTTK